MSFLSSSRPALDDVKVLQQELSSLHLLLEQASSDRDKQVQQLTSERDKLSEEKTRLCEQKARIEEQMESLKVETTSLTRKENVAMWVCVYIDIDYLPPSYNKFP